MMFNGDGRKRGAMVSYAAARSSSESRCTSEQQFIEFGEAPMMTHNNRNSPTKNNPFLVPWGSPRGLDRASEFSPKKQHGQMKKHDNSPPNYGKSERFHNKQDYNDNYSDKEDVDDYGRDLKCYGGVCVRDDQKIYDSGKSKHQGNSYRQHVPPKSYDDRYKGSSSPRSYPFSNKPLKRETKDKLGRNNNVPRIDAHYESSHSSPVGNSLSPIKTRPNYTSKGTDFPNSNQRTNPTVMQQQPICSSSKDREYQETIDDNEALRRHAESKVDENYKGTIDCVEAARRYNGVFVR